MLKAIEHGKISRFTDSTSSNQAAFHPSEDSLTSSVIGLLLYLPDSTFWQLLRDACYGLELPEESGLIVDVDFWPKWSAAGTKNKNFVEPDVFIRFEKFDLLIEAKRWDERQQVESQWESQICAYHNEYRDEQSNKLYLVALGGIHEDSSKNILGAWVVKARWYGLLEQVNVLLAIPETPQVKRTLEDAVIAFRFHGYMQSKWLSEWSSADLSLVDAGAQDKIKGVFSWITS